VISRTGDRSWLHGDSRTWRWNEGSYEERGSYDAVEASPAGLDWYHWNHRHGDGGSQARHHQTFAEFAQSGPMREMPDALCTDLRRWLAEHGHAQQAL
jgi:hypothetical protein